MAVQLEHEFAEDRRYDCRENMKESADVGGGPWRQNERHVQCKPAENSELREIEKQ